MKGERGIALITTLLLGLVAVVLIGVLLYVLTTGTRISGIEKRYSVALEAAKGASEYIIELLLSGNLTCGGGGACGPGNDEIDLGPYSNLQGFNITAQYLGEVSRFGVYVYSIRVTATSPATGESAVIDFVYRVQ
jgi:Flp pilus assembly pilin Flp